MQFFLDIAADNQDDFTHQRQHFQHPAFLIKQWNRIYPTQPVRLFYCL